MKFHKTKIEVTKICLITQFYLNIAKTLVELRVAMKIKKPEL